MDAAGKEPVAVRRCNSPARATERLCKRLEVRLEQQIVGVTERDDLAARRVDPCVSSGRNAALLLTEDANRSLVSLGDCGSLVCGPVIDDDELERTVRLPEDRGHCGTDRGRRLMRWHH